MLDVVIIGGGHAGVEAGLAAARCGARVAIVVFDPQAIGAMSCNPAIGGLGKGHIVREIDAFDGVMARAADAAAIHHRMLNRSKGPAVQGPRVQADRRLYAFAIRDAVAASGVTIVTGEAAALLVERGRVVGISLQDGTALKARSVVVATGTFLGGMLFRGEERLCGGRINEPGATRLAAQFRELALPLGRLKTGTPPRIDGRTVDWSSLAEQPSDVEPWTMSPLTTGRKLPQIACAITRTNAATHAIIRDNLHRSPLYTGAIDALGPRYCPSIEDKVSRFGDRDGHQIFLEPEGLDDPVIYPNGLSTSLPAEVQLQVLRTLPGLAAVAVMTPGYAVEYDHVDPRALDRRLALATLPGLFLAGQINGTTGYEEAAGQGLIAGLNAAAEAMGRPPVVLDRASSYIGVMIDDLVLQGVTEPYRMLTARAEFRLALRCDNAETRLGPVAEKAGCLSAARRAHQHKRAAQRATFSQRLHAAKSDPHTVAQTGIAVSQDGRVRSAWEWLRLPGVRHDTVAPGASAGIDATVVDEVVQDARYAPYLERQQVEAERLAQDEAITLDKRMDYAAVPGLSIEMIERLRRARPSTLAEAGRVRGVTPAALSALLLHHRRRAA